MPYYEQYDSHDEMIPMPKSDNFHEADEQLPSADDDSHFHYEEDARSDMSESDPGSIPEGKKGNLGLFKSLMQSSDANNSAGLRSSEQRDYKNEIAKLYKRCLDLVDQISEDRDSSEAKRQIEELHIIATNFCAYNSTLTEEIENLESIRLSLENDRDANLQKSMEMEARIVSECDVWKLKYKDAMEELEAAEQALYADKERAPAATEKQTGEDMSDLRHKVISLEENLQLVTAEKAELQVAFNQVMAKMEVANSIETDQAGEKVIPAVIPGDFRISDALADENERLKLEMTTLKNERDGLSQEVIRLTTESVQRREQSNDLIELSTSKGESEASRKLVATEGFNVLIEKTSIPKKQMTQVASVDIDPEPVPQLHSTTNPTKIPTGIMKSLPSGVDISQIEMELKKVGVSDASEIHLHIHQHGHKHKHIHNHSHSHSHLYNVKQTVQV